MPMNLKLATVLEKNKTVTDKPWLILLDVRMDPVGNPTDVLRLVANNDDITYKGNTYTAFNFTLDNIEQKSDGQLGQVMLKVSNVNRIVEGELQQYSGGTDATVDLYVVNYGDLSGDPELHSQYTILKTTCDEQWVSFTLGAENPMRKAFPSKIYMSNICPYEYNTPAMQTNCDPRGALCGYEGSLPSCSKHLDGDNGCRAHSNEANFGGAPGIYSAGFRRATA